MAINEQASQDFYRKAVLSKGCKPRLGIALSSGKCQPLRALCLPLSRYRRNGAQSIYSIWLKADSDWNPS